MTHNHRHENRVVKGNEAIRKQREAAAGPTRSSITGVVRIVAGVAGVAGMAGDASADPYAAEIPVRLDVREPIDQGGRDQGDGSVTLTFTATRRADWRREHGHAFRLDADAVKELVKQLEHQEKPKPADAESGT
jgi:hypothetical protein